MTVRNFFLSLVLSLVLTFVITVLYVSYPVLWLILGSMFRSPNTHSDGIATVAGGVSGSFLLIVVVMASVLFLLIFTLLQKRSRR